MSKPKFCCNCEHFRRATQQCGHPSLAGEPELVMGHADHPDCKDARAEGGACGPEAKLFRVPTPYPVCIPW